MGKIEENKAIDDLLRLAVENTELPIVPMVNAEITGDDYSYYKGTFSSVLLDEYIISRDGRKIMFKSDNDVFDVLDKMLSEEDFRSLPDSDEECEKIYNALPWVRAIIVYIDE